MRDGAFFILPQLFFIVTISVILGIVYFLKWDRFDLAVQKIIKKRVWGARKVWPSAEIQAINLVEKIQRSSRYANLEKSRQYDVVIHFQSGEEIRILQVNALLFGYAPERLLWILDKLYPGKLASTKWLDLPEQTPVPKQGDDAQATRMLDLGHQLLRESKIRAAVIAYEKAMQLSSLYPQLHAIIGEQYYALGDYESAIAAYRQSLEIAPAQVDFLPHYGQALLKLKKYDESAGILERATQENPKDYQSFYSGAMALNKVGRHEDAKSSLECALSLKPEWIARAKQNPLLSQYLSDA